MWMYHFIKVFQKNAFTMISEKPNVFCNNFYILKTDTVAIFFRLFINVHFQKLNGNQWQKLTDNKVKCSY